MCISCYGKEWKAMNPEKRKAQDKKYRLKHKEERREYNRKWRKNNPEKMKERRREYNFRRNKQT